MVAWCGILLLVLLACGCCLVDLDWIVRLRIACDGSFVWLVWWLFLILDLCLVVDWFGAAFAGFVERLFCIGG